MNETWKIIPINSRYEASNLGRIRNARKGKVLLPWFHRSGHLYINLGRNYRSQVHHLVLMAFGVEKTAPEQECRHLDGNPANNALSNLKWGTRRENIEDYKKMTGRYLRASISDAKAAQIRSEFNGEHGQQTKLARRFNVSPYVVNGIVLGKTYVGA